MCPMPNLCFQFPPSPNKNHKNPSPCTLEMPYLFKSLQNLHYLVFNLFESASKTLSLSTKPFGPPQIALTLNEKNQNKNNLRSPEEQGELEHRALASALATGKDATLIEFYSPKCRLCNSLLDLVMELESRNSDWLNIVMADAENEKWLPEVATSTICITCPMKKAELLLASLPFSPRSGSSFSITISSMFLALYS